MTDILMFIIDKLEVRKREFLFYESCEFVE